LLSLSHRPLHRHSLYFTHPCAASSTRARHTDKGDELDLRTIIHDSTSRERRRRSADGTLLQVLVGSTQPLEPFLTQARGLFGFSLLWPRVPARGLGRAQARMQAILLHARDDSSTVGSCRDERRRGGGAEDFGSGDDRAGRFPGVERRYHAAVRSRAQRPRGSCWGRGQTRRHRGDMAGGHHFNMPRRSDFERSWHHF